MKFSQRIGKTPSAKSMQLNSMDGDLRNGIWNAIKLYVLDPTPKYSQYSGATQFEVLAQVLWHHFYKLPIDTVPAYPTHIEERIREKYFISKWYEVYDLLEFFVGLNPDSIRLDREKLKEFCNGIFEREFSGYRFIDNTISPITNTNETNEIEEAINTTGQYTSFKGANIHLHSSLAKLSDKLKPDYRNSIKESISAIESVTKALSDNKKDSLGDALNRIKDAIKIHPALEKGFRQIYGYTSDGNGIRHALMEDDSCDFEDAKYMLVSSSAFINYLIVKATKAGIQLD